MLACPRPQPSNPRSSLGCTFDQVTNGSNIKEGGSGDSNRRDYLNRCWNYSSATGCRGVDLAEDVKSSPCTQGLYSTCHHKSKSECSFECIDKATAQRSKFIEEEVDQYLCEGPPGKTRSMWNNLHYILFSIVRLRYLVS